MRLGGFLTTVALLALAVVAFGYSDSYDSYGSSSSYSYRSNGHYGEYPPHSRYENASYAYYINQKLYHAFADKFPPAVYPYLLCVEKLDSNSYQPYDDSKDSYDADYKAKFFWRAHFGYYSAYYEPYKVCKKCSYGYSFDGKKHLKELKAPREFVTGYSAHFPNSAYHVDFDDHKNAYASWQIKYLTALATRKSQRCPIYKYSRLVYKESPYIDVGYMKSAYSLHGPWVDRANTTWYGEGNSKTRNAGYTYFGQFVDHDITKDNVPSSELDEIYNSDKNKYFRKPDWYTWPPYKINNGRTPLLDLDSVYGRYGREDKYRDEEDHDKLKEGEGNDVPRYPDGTAMIPEARNDENIIVAQFHYLFIEFHNTLVDWIRERDYGHGCKESIAVFERARKIVLWHYQYLVLNAFLPKIVDHGVLHAIHRYGRQHYVGLKAQQMHIPIEFSAAAYRLHTVVRDAYMINKHTGFKHLFNPMDMSGTSDMRGGRYLHNNSLEVDWRLFFEFDDEPVRSLPGRLLDENVVPSLLNLPKYPAHASIVDDIPLALPVRSMLRGAIYGIASGEDIAKAFHVPHLHPEYVDWYVDGYWRQDGNYNGQYGKHSDYDYKNKNSYDDKYKGYEGTPLWFYLCREGVKHNKGERLGYVGSIIVAETLIGLLQADPDSYLNAAPGFKPFLYSHDSYNGRKCAYEHKCIYSFQDLLDFTDLRKPKSS